MGQLEVGTNQAHWAQERNTGSSLNHSRSNWPYILERHGETRTKILAAVPFEDRTTYSVTIFVGIYF